MSSPTPILATSILATHCAVLLHPAGAAAAGLAGMFLLGVSGGFTHCGAMCGPLVLGQVTERLAAVPAARMCEAHRLRAGLLLPYHAGRLATYAALGAVSGAAGLGMVARIAPLRVALLLFAAAMLLASAAGWLPRGAPAWPGKWVRRLDRSRAGGTFLFGMALGLLPCGLLYAALVGACALATPARGALGMLAFGSGTVPLLAIIGIGGQARMFGRALPWLKVFNASVLVAAAIGGVLV